SREPAQHAGLVVDRRQDDVRAVHRAVLARAPALGLVASCRRCRVEVALRHAQLDVLRAIETGEMLPYDFMRAVAVDELRPGVPAQHPSLRIELDEAV